jgi:hypothetical protein
MELGGRANAILSLVTDFERNEKSRVRLQYHSTLSCKTKVSRRLVPCKLTSPNRPQIWTFISWICEPLFLIIFQFSSIQLYIYTVYQTLLHSGMALRNYIHSEDIKGSISLVPGSQKDKIVINGDSTLRIGVQRHVKDNASCCLSQGQ